MLEVCSQVSGLSNYFNMYQSVHLKEADLGLQYSGTCFTKAVTIILGGIGACSPLKCWNIRFWKLDFSFLFSKHDFESLSNNDE